MGHSFCLSCGESLVSFQAWRGSGQLGVSGSSLCWQGLRLYGGNGSSHRRADSGLRVVSCSSHLCTWAKPAESTDPRRVFSAGGAATDRAELGFGSFGNLSTSVADRARACGLRRSCQRASCEGPGAWSELQSRRAASFWSLVRSKRSSRSWSSASCLPQIQKHSELHKRAVALPQALVLAASGVCLPYLQRH